MVMAELCNILKRETVGRLHLKEEKNITARRERTGMDTFCVSRISKDSEEFDEKQVISFCFHTGRTHPCLCFLLRVKSSSDQASLWCTMPFLFRRR